MTQRVTTTADPAAFHCDHIVLVSVFGVDKPGITSSISAILAEYQVTVLDIGQSVIHNHLNLGIVAAVPESENRLKLQQAIEAAVQARGNQVRFESIDMASYADWVGQQGKARHIVTLLGRQITAEHIAALTAIAVDQGLNFDSITRLSGRIPLEAVSSQGQSSIEFSARGTPTDITALRAECMKLSQAYDIDIAVQADSIFRRHRRLVCFDMDSTLIEAEVIDELAIEAGVGEQVAAITERAMAGELGFDESFAQRMALLEGLSETVLAKVACRLRLTEGAEKLFHILQCLGYKTAILSGGFDYFARYLQAQLGVDYIYANQLDIVDGALSGRVIGEIVNGERKARLLQELAQREQISLEQVIAVGDGANDLPMLSIAGLGIAFRAKPLVKASAKQSISQMGLDGILYLMGLSDRDMAVLSETAGG